MQDIMNDNDPARGLFSRHAPDAYGQAALLLVESLIHGLTTRGVLTVGEAVEIIEVAAEVKKELADSFGDTHETLQQSLRLLSAMAQSLRHDLT